MIDYMGWSEAGELIQRGIQGAIIDKQVTFDLARQMENVEPISCSEFGKAIIDQMNS